MTWNADTPRTPIEDRFWAKVEKTATCWLWTGAKIPYGYGRLFSGSRTPAGSPKTVAVHRFAYELLVGPIPDGLTIDHLCKNPSCVNPEHLEVVTLTENLRRGDGPASINARKTECDKGHPLHGENLGLWLNGSRGLQRRCRECKKAKARERYHLRKLEGLKTA